MMNQLLTTIRVNRVTSERGREEKIRRKRGGEKGTEGERQEGKRGVYRGTESQ